MRVGQPDDTRVPDSLLERRRLPPEPRRISKRAMSSQRRAVRWILRRPRPEIVWNREEGERPHSDLGVLSSSGKNEVASAASPSSSPRAGRALAVDAEETPEAPDLLLEHTRGDAAEACAQHEGSEPTWAAIHRAPRH